MKQTSNIKKSIESLFGSIKKKYPHKVLILEGGGMRGVFPTGVLQGFADRNFFPWKLIIGSSAGALTGASYAVNQIHLSRDAFFTKLLTGKFIHLSRVLNYDKHVLDLDWMIDTVVHGDEPLKEQLFKKSCEVLITATHCDDFETPETIFLSSKEEDVITALKASAAIPFLYRGFVEYKNYHLLDGGMLDPIPYKKAIELGYKEKDILVVLTRPKGYRKKEESFWIKYIYESYYKENRFKYIIEALETRYKMYNAVLDDLEENHPEIEIIYPPDDFEVDRLTQDKEKICEGFEQGVNETREYLKRHEILGSI